MIKISILAFLTLILLTQNLVSQNYISGKVTDSITNKPLAFVNIVVNESSYGTSTDIDGNFKLISQEEIKYLKLSYVGYKPQKVNVVNNSKNNIISLKKEQIKLSEVTIIPGKNPAHRIIKQAARNRKKNDPENYPHYKCEIYSKLIYDIYLNNGFYNAWEEAKKDTSRSDSSYIMWNTFSKQHFGIMESFSERKYLKPDKVDELITGTRVSGFKNPGFGPLATDFQPFSFYKTNINMLDKSFLNPISNSSTNKYFFLLKDTLYEGKDTVFIISFQPRRGKNIDALKGVLYINTDGFAVQNVIASPADTGLIDIKIQQKYTKAYGKWFPEQLNYELLFRKYPSEKINMAIYGKSYIKKANLSDIVLNKEISRINYHLEKDAAKRDSVYWDKHRNAPLSEKEKQTYIKMDSLGKEMNLDGFMNTYISLFELKIPVKFIDINIDKIVKRNKYESYRWGLGLHTNEKISEFFSVGGFFGYGTRDKE